MPSIWKRVEKLEKQFEKPEVKFACLGEYKYVDLNSELALFLWKELERIEQKKATLTCFTVGDHGRGLVSHDLAEVVKLILKHLELDVTIVGAKSSELHLTPKSKE